MNINFNNGMQKVILNDDPNTYIMFNPNDMGILNRLDKAQKSMNEKISKLIEENKEKENSVELTLEMFKSLDEISREELDNILGKGTCDTVFGNMNLMTMDDNGEFIVNNFLNAIIPYITEKIAESLDKHQENVSKHTRKYTKSK